MVKSILYKDFCTLGIWNYFLFKIPLIVIAAAAAIGRLSEYVLFLLFFIFSEAVLNELWTDDNQGWTKYSYSLMMPRSTVVNTKYLQLLANAAAGLLLVELCLSAGCAVRGETPFSLCNIAVISTVMFVVSLVSAALSLMIFRHKVLSIVLVSSAAGAVGSTLGASEADKLADRNVIDFLFSGLDQEFGFVLNVNFHLAVIVVCAVFTVLMWLITLILYKRKDF